MPSAQQLKSRFKHKQIVKQILKYLLYTGCVWCYLGSRQFIYDFFNGTVGRELDIIWDDLNNKEKKQLRNVFNYLQKRGMIKIKKVNNQIYISLTKEGKKKAKYFQIDDLEIPTPKVWDKKWRILMFDIPENVRLKREALRGKLKQLKFTMIQKSVWIHPYPCKDEVILLQDFFGFKDNITGN